MKFFISLIFFFTSLFASILDTNIVGVGNDDITISSSADMYAYLAKLGDQNLTDSYRQASEPINRLENPYLELADVYTYESAFANLRFFYESLYDKNSTKFLNAKLAALENEKKLIIDTLLQANRKQFTDETIIALLVQYAKLSRKIDIIILTKDNMYKTAVIIVRKVLNKEYSFSNNINNLKEQVKDYNTQAQEAKNNTLKAIYENKALVTSYDIVFQNDILNIQNANDNNKWSSDSFVTASNIKISILPDANVSKEYAIRYEQALSDANVSMRNYEINSDIIAIIFQKYGRSPFQRDFDKFLLKADERIGYILDYSLFVFQNNNIQVSDILHFLETLIFALALQWSLILMLKKKYAQNTPYLSIFLIKSAITGFIIYYFATSVLNLNTSNLAMFASAFSIAIGFGMQSLIQNLVAGIIMLGDKTIKVGDYISIGGQNGVVQSVTYRTTTVRTSDNTIVMIPNSKIFLETLENKTKSDPRVWIKPLLLVDKGTNLVAVESVLIKAAEQIPGVDKSHMPELVVNSITKDGIMIELRLLVADIQYADSAKAARILYDALQNEHIGM